MPTIPTIVVTLLFNISLIRLISGNLLLILLMLHHTILLMHYFLADVIKLDCENDVCQCADPDSLWGQLQCLAVQIILNTEVIHE